MWGRRVGAAGFDRVVEQAAAIAVLGAVWVHVRSSVRVCVLLPCCILCCSLRVTQVCLPGRCPGSRQQHAAAAAPIALRPLLLEAK